MSPPDNKMTKLASVNGVGSARSGSPLGGATHPRLESLPSFSLRPPRAESRVQFTGGGNAEFTNSFFPPTASQLEL